MNSTDRSCIVGLLIFFVLMKVGFAPLLAGVVAFVVFLLWPW
jgi:hypothetical protein